MDNDRVSNILDEESGEVLLYCHDLSHSTEEESMALSNDPRYAQLSVVLYKALRFSDFTYPQLKCAYSMLDGNDTFIALPTGSGKSGIFHVCHPRIIAQMDHNLNQFISWLVYLRYEGVLQWF